MARPLREQFALATLLLLIPVSGVIVWAGRNAYNEQLVTLTHEAERLATSVSAHISQTPADTVLDLTAFLAQVKLPPGSAVIVSASSSTATSVSPPRSISSPRVDE